MKKNGYEEKMMALDALKAAMDRVDEAVEAIEKFGEAFDLSPKGKTVPLDVFVKMVADVLEKKECCVRNILYTAFDMIKDLDLTIVDEDEEDEDDE